VGEVEGGWVFSEFPGGGLGGGGCGTVIGEGWGGLWDRWRMHGLGVAGVLGMGVLFMTFIEIYRKCHLFSAVLDKPVLQ
jgi:hypothetical protein